ncbi:MAG TPA: RNA polymerase sigma factor [Ktedonosporobacter sp.]|nr:RNA polymerase sigma factor [Ktedonosporobacter sp.]
MQQERELVEQAREGSQQALETLIKRVQDQVYNLALRMLQFPADAEDATQEILIRVITHLSEFRQESAFSTWVYRIATNYLLTTRKLRGEQQQLTFQFLGKRLDESLAMGEASIPDGYEQHLLVKEVQYHCTLGMLLCLDRVHRIAFLLGEIFEVSGEEGAYIMQTTPATFRKRLSRARGQIRAFVQQKCGIVNPDNPCRCAKHVGNEIRARVLRPEKLRYVTAERVIPDAQEVRAGVRELHELDRAAALFRTHPTYKAPDGLMKGVRQLLSSGQFALFAEDRG